jgi:hypothetical protein
VASHFPPLSRRGWQNATAWLKATVRSWWFSSVRLSKKDSGDVSYVKRIQRRFEASVLSYQKYRCEQCGLYQALSNMSVYTDEIKLACEGMLDSDRAQQLKHGKDWRN